VTLYENNHYVVVPTTPNDEEYISRDGADYFSWYEVVNKETTITELKVPALPEAVNAAAVMDVTLTNEPWQWFYKENPQEEAPPDTDLGYLQ